MRKNRHQPIYVHITKIEKKRLNDKDDGNKNFEEFFKETEGEYSFRVREF